MRSEGQDPVLGVIRARRSVRAYLEKEVPQQIEQALFEAGRLAPNAWDRQSFVLCKLGPRARRALVALTARHLGGVEADHNFFGAPLVVLFLDRRENFERRADTGCVLENMMLAAQSFGLGSVWVDQFATLEDAPDLAELLENYGFDRQMVICGAVAFGWPDPAEEILPRPLRSEIITLE